MAEFEVEIIHRWEFDKRGELLWLGGADSHCWDNYATNITTTHTRGGCICNIASLTRLKSYIAQLNLWKFVCKTYQILNITPMTQLMESVTLAVCHRDTTLITGKKSLTFIKTDIPVWSILHQVSTSRLRESLFFAASSPSRRSWRPAKDWKPAKKAGWGSPSMR